MRKLLLILIFIPSFLFAQDSKNLELVNIINYNIQKPANSSQSEIVFTVDSNHVLKITSMTMTDVTCAIMLNDEKLHSYLNNVKYYAPLPILLSQGVYTLVLNASYSNINSATIFCQEFKLTTP